MKCVAEILEIREKALIEKAIEEAKLDEQAKAEQLEAIPRTIEYCENELNDRIVHRAKTLLSSPLWDRVTIEGDFVKDRLGKVYFCPLKRDKISYANGELSYSVDRNVKYDYELFVQYLKQFCYKVTQESWSYKCYGSGQCTGVRLIITPNIE